MALDFIGEVLLDIVGEVLGYGTGRVVIAVLSLGTARGERIRGDRYRSPSRLFWREGNQLVISAGATTFVGIVFWIALGIAVYLIMNR